MNNIILVPAATKILMMGRLEYRNLRKLWGGENLVSVNIVVSCTAHHAIQMIWPSCLQGFCIFGTLINTQFLRWLNLIWTPSMTRWCENFPIKFDLISVPCHSFWSNSHSFCFCIYLYIIKQFNDTWSCFLILDAMVNKSGDKGPGDQGSNLAETKKQRTWWILLIYLNL